MVNVEIIERGCRGCTLCVDICPVDVFEMEKGTELAKVVRTQDCIGCLSCHYICPSQCVVVSGVEQLRPFHRIEEHAAFIEKFIQAQTAAGSLTDDDMQEAYADVSARLLALAAAITECMGRGLRAVGRRAGTLGAKHLPEMYEEKSLEDVLKRMQGMFKNSFVFDYSLDGDSVDMTFKPCGICAVVENAGEKVGEAIACQLFHEFWAGLLTAFAGKRFTYSVPQAGKTCVMKLEA